MKPTTPGIADTSSVFNPAALPGHRRAEFLPLRIHLQERTLKQGGEWEQWTPEEERGRRWVMDLRPLHPADALACLTARAARPGWTVLIGFERTPGGAEGALAAAGETARNVTDFVETVGAAAAAGPEFLVLDDVALMRALRHGLAGFTQAIRVEPGPTDRVEAWDLQNVIAAAMTPKASPLEADLRTIAWLRFADGGAVTIASRRRAVVHELAAEATALFVACQLGAPSRDVARPEAWRIGQLLGVSGHLELHPKEALLTSTFVDVGCCCSAPTERHPAAVSLIYDLPSRSWHGEEG